MKLATVPGTQENPKVTYTDNSLEFGKACEDLSWNHCTSTPHRSETNGIAERAVRRVKEGTSAVLLQSGLNESWWADSMECYTCLRNVTDLLSDGKTPYERRFGKPFGGPIIPFGSLVAYHPITAKDQSRIHQLGKKVLPGLFLGYALYAGGTWKGDIMLVDIEELETMDASEIYSKRLNSKEVIFPKEKGEFIFSIADGRIKTPGGDQELRTSTSIRERPIRGESHVDFLGESEWSLPPPRDSFPDAGEAISDFWSMSGSFIYRHHVEPRVKLYSPREESFPIPLLKYIDGSRTTLFFFFFLPTRCRINIHIALSVDTFQSRKPAPLVLLLRPMTLSHVTLCTARLPGLAGTGILAQGPIPSVAPANPAPDIKLMLVLPTDPSPSAVWSDVSQLGPSGQVPVSLLLPSLEYIS